MVGVGGGKPEENERLNRQRKGRKQIQNILKTGTNKREREGRKKAVEKYLFQGKEKWRERREMGKGGRRGKSQR